MSDRRDILKLASAAALSGLMLAFPVASIAVSMRKLLFVHGRGQQGRDPEALKSEWLEALTRGAAQAGETVPSGLDVAFPYYGDVLEKYTRAFDIPLTSDLKARGNQLDDQFLVFQAEFAEAVRQGAGITDAQVDEEYGADPTPRGPLNWRWVQAILRAIDKHAQGMSMKTLEVFTRDVFLYTTHAGVRDEIDSIVAAQLTEEPTIVVGHSLGTVVAYSVLRNDRRALHIPLFVTVGSPLAVRAVRDQLKPLRSPRPVEKWYNAYDSRDVVALYPLDGKNFPVDPPVENNADVRNHTDNRHGIAGYLDDPLVARRILSGMHALST